MFFFEKKNQKTFGLRRTWPGGRRPQRIKVFCFFSSEKKTFLSLLFGISCLLSVAWCGAALAADHVRFGLDWLAEAEYGGYYEAAADGAYARHGIDVDIRQGGPQVNQAQLLLAGRLDFTISGNSFLALNFAQEGIPFVAVAAIFQKDPSIVLAHPGVGHDSFAALKGVPIMIGSDTRVGWWNFVRAKFGYSDAQIRPYTFNLAPFLADKMAVQQGYLGSEPFLVKQAAGFDPVVLSLADAGFAGYASLIATSRETVTTRADLVRRFLAATAEGWHDYLDGDPAPGNALIKQANPEMTDALLAYGRQALKSHGIVESGDALRLGIGAMTDARWADFFHSMVAAGLYPAGLDYHAAYTLQFVDQPKSLQ
jgi:NitT/TauT family transport system substrate-binding protein